ncbi:hypothetical protein K469DRAFT_636722, partial [Zopfia rhizophila CBS 207.26]
MVNTGRPSSGCFACRKRKIKCDEQRPECFLCMKRYQSCPGYREETTVFFRDQSTWAKDKVQKRIGASPSPLSDMQLQPHVPKEPHRDR